MSQALDNQLVESIVAGVMDRLRTGSVSAHTNQATTKKQENREYVAPRGGVTIPDRVITEAVLVERLQDATNVQFANKAVLTPTARDYLRVNQITWSRKEAGRAAGIVRSLAIIVNEAPSVTRIVQEVLPGTRRELLGCVDDAARLAASEVARGGSDFVLIFARQIHRAACLANRQSTVRAAAARDIAEIAAIRSQLRTNVWCLDPTNRGSFEMKNLMKAAASQKQGD